MINISCVSKWFYDTITSLIPCITTYLIASFKLLCCDHYYDCLHLFHWFSRYHLLVLIVFCLQHLFWIVTGRILFMQVFRNVFNWPSIVFGCFILVYPCFVSWKHGENCNTTAVIQINSWISAIGHIVWMVMLLGRSWSRVSPIFAKIHFSKM